MDTIVRAERKSRINGGQVYQTIDIPLGTPDNDGLANDLLGYAGERLNLLRRHSECDQVRSVIRHTGREMEVSDRSSDSTEAEPPAESPQHPGHAVK